MAGFTKEGVGFNDHETSKVGAGAVAPSKRDLVLKALLEAGPAGLADFQLEERTAYRNAAQRRGELVKAKIVRELDILRKNPTTDVNQAVWSAFDEQDKPLAPNP